MYNIPPTNLIKDRISGLGPPQYLDNDEETEFMNF